MSQQSPTLIKCISTNGMQTAQNIQLEEIKFHTITQNTLKNQLTQICLTTENDDELNLNDSPTKKPLNQLNNQQKNGVPQKNQQKQQTQKNDNQKQKFDFNFGTNVFTRLFLIDLFKLLIQASKHSKLYKSLSIKNLPQLNPKQNINIIYEKAKKYMEKATEEAKKNDNKLKSKDMISVFFKTFKIEIISIFLIIIFQLVFKLVSSILLSYLISTVKEEGLVYESYLYAVGMNLAILFYVLLWYNSMRFISSITSMFRSVFMKTLYNKVTKLSANTIKEANLGKLVNLISNDLNTLENRLNLVIMLLTTPITIVSVGAILFYRFGGAGLIGLGFMIAICPLQICFSKLSSHFFSEKAKLVDQRVNLTGEIIEGIRLLKMYAWEEAFQHTVNAIRKVELRKIFMMALIGFIDNAISTSSGVLGSFLSFYFIYYYGDTSNLNLATIFSSLDLLQFIKQTVVQVFGVGFSGIFEMKIIMKRLISVVTLDESSMVCISGANEYQTKLLEKGQIFFNNFNAYWEISQPVLSDLNLTIQPKDCVCILGKVGSGKSTFLSCILKEIPFYKGNFAYNGKIAYVEQEPYIFNTTLKENILFGKPYNSELYNRVIKDCCMLEDIAQLSFGDETQLGEKGLNLSGGQKARISLARAVYSEADIYLLDDPLSAVDSKVAKKLFSQVILNLRQTSTVILVTHQIYFSRHADKIIIMESGKIRCQGSYLETKDQVQELEVAPSSEEAEEENPEEDTSTQEQLEQSESQNSSFNKDRKVSKALSTKSKNLKVEVTKQSTINRSTEQIIVREEDENINVSYKTYFRYLKLSSIYLTWPLVVILYACNDVTYVIYNKILGNFDDAPDSNNDTLIDLLLYIMLGYILLQILKRILLSININSSGKKLHFQMLKSLIRSKVSYFDRNPSGRILNRFSTDIGTLDYDFNSVLQETLESLSAQIIFLISIAINSPFFILISVFQFIFLGLIVRSFKKSLIKTKQIDLQFKSPLYTHFNITIQGVIPLKVYDQVPNFESKFDSLLTDSFRATYYNQLIQRGFAGLIQLYATIINTIGILFIMSSTGNGSSIGQAITLFMASNETLQRGIRQMIQVDITMTNTQRCFNIIDLEQEPPQKTQYDNQHNLTLNKQLIKKEDKTSTKEQFPQKGDLQFQNVKIKYRSDLDYILKGLTFNIKSGERVGFVGRTGAGKSTIIQALFRMLDLEHSTDKQQSDDKEGIFIDGHNIQKIGLHTLRNGISIIPQIPFIFSGTIRNNFDPLNKYDDQQIIDVLKEIGLYQKVQNLPSKLMTDLTNNQQMFSIGEKQLICLGRVILRQSKIIVLDEATANCDMNTDELIQRLIREKFQNSTVLTIAHRLNTIADYDKIIVMGSGKVIEQGCPYELLQDKKGTFYQMVENTGQQNRRTIVRVSTRQFTLHQNQNISEEDNSD